MKSWKARKRHGSEKMNSDNKQQKLGKKWQDIVNGFFAVPSILVFGFLMLGMVVYAIGMIIFFGSLLFAAGINQFYGLLPPLTRILIVTSPAVFLAGWLIGRMGPSTLLVVILVVIYGFLNIISNLWVPTYMGREGR